ncbi:MAG: VRR-NUC domain-containing protein [Clostridia bacterium]
MRERTIERKLVKAIKNSGGIALKFVCQNYDGMPDRIILMPGGKMFFVEVKSPGETPRPLQKARHMMLRRLGFTVYLVDSEQHIGEIVDAIYTT